MDEKKIYLSAEKWWEDRKKILNEDLVNATDFVTDPDIIKLMQELLKRTEINTINKFDG